MTSYIQLTKKQPQPTPFVQQLSKYQDLEQQTQSINQQLQQSQRQPQNEVSLNNSKENHSIEKQFSDQKQKKQVNINIKKQQFDNNKIKTMPAEEIQHFNNNFNNNYSQMSVFNTPINNILRNSKTKFGNYDDSGLSLNSSKQQQQYSNNNTLKKNNTQKQLQPLQNKSVKNQKNLNNQLNTLQNPYTKKIQDQKQLIQQKEAKLQKLVQKNKENDAKSKQKLDVQLNTQKPKKHARSQMNPQQEKQNTPTNNNYEKGDNKLNLPKIEQQGKSKLNMQDSQNYSQLQGNPDLLKPSSIKNIKNGIQNSKFYSNDNIQLKDQNYHQKPYTSQDASTYDMHSNINNFNFGNNINNSVKEKSFAQRNLFTNKNNSEPFISNSNNKFLNENEQKLFQSNNTTKHYAQIPSNIQPMLQNNQRVYSQQVNGIKQRELLKSNFQNQENTDSTFNQQMNKLQVQQGIIYTVKTKAGCTINRQSKTNQDSNLVNPKVIEDLGFHFFGVFDGHGVNGHLASQTIKKKLGVHLGNQLSLLRDRSPTSIKNCLQVAYKLTNQEILDSNYDCNLSGSTAVSVLLDLQENKIYCANVGDSRAILARKLKNNQKQNMLASLQINQYTTVTLSEDQKPSNERERIRIQQSGGRICSQKDVYGNPIGPLRVWLKDADIPGLAMTRSMGDTCGKQAGVSSEPEIKQFNIQDEDKFIILGSDGLFDFIHNNDLIKTVSSFYEKGILEQGAERLITDAVSAWRRETFSRDDITCIIIGLPQNLNLQNQFYLNQDFSSKNNNNNYSSSQSRKIKPSYFKDNHLN